MDGAIVILLKKGGSLDSYKYFSQNKSHPECIKVNLENKDLPVKAFTCKII